jgi:hypothetical protein
LGESQYPHTSPSTPTLLENPELLTELVMSPGSEFPLPQNCDAFLELCWFFFLGEIALRKLGNRILLHQHYVDQQSGKVKSESERAAELKKNVEEFDLQIKEW